MGKTLAFAVPVIEKLLMAGAGSLKPGRKPRVLVMAPTRELAKQVCFFCFVFCLDRSSFHIMQLVGVGADNVVVIFFDQDLILPPHCLGLRATPSYGCVDSSWPRRLQPPCLALRPWRWPSRSAFGA